MTALASGPWETHGGYLLSHSVGLPPRGPVEDAVGRYLAAWEDDGGEAWPTWLATIDGFRGALAGLLSTEPETICPQTNVSSGVTKILQAIRDPARAARTPTIVLSELAFPSVGYVCQQAGYSVRYVPMDEPATDPDVWREHLGDDVDAVLVNHVHSNTGELIPVGPIVDLALAGLRSR